MGKRSRILSSRRAKWARPAIDHGDLISKPSYAPIAAIWMGIASLFIMTYTPPTHAIVIDLPVPYQSSEDDPVVDLKVNKVTVDAYSEMFWNGQSVNADQLIKLAHETKQEPVTPLLIFEPDGDARYDVSAGVLAALHAAGLTADHFCFGGIEQHRRFGKYGDGGSAFSAYASVRISSHDMIPPPITTTAECDRAAKKYSTDTAR